MTQTDDTVHVDFIHAAIIEDLASGRFTEPVVTRFPPEPNGYLHIGHAKAIHIAFSIAADKAGRRCHLRFDDTNPTKEEQEYVDAIKKDIHWLGFDWGEHEYYTSDYFEQLYDWAAQLIKQGDAFVCDLTGEEIREQRGTLTEPGKNSPYHDRSVEENMDLFARMRAGEFEDGARTLRAKIDMTSPNINMRDPVIYRILRATHPRCGDTWCIYPTYDWAHGQSDSIEKITHSTCSLEFEDHRPLYNWCIEKLGIHYPRQIEFGRLNLSHTVMSKRWLRQLVEENHVSGWDDPRMPTISGMRRRGYSPESIRNFCAGVGIAKRPQAIEMSRLEHAVREDLNKHSNRVMAVLHPLKVVIENYPEGQVEEMDAVNNPEDASAGSRKVPFSRVLYIEQSDFMEDPPKKFFRLGIGREVRLRYAYFVTCTEAIKDDAGNVVELRCTYDPETYGGNAPDGRKVKGTIHWVSAQHAVLAEVRNYETLFSHADPSDVPEGGSFIDHLNPDSLEVLSGVQAEPCLADAKPLTRVQFERTGYFCVDADSKPGAPVFNRTVPLRDRWAKIKAKGG